MLSLDDFLNTTSWAGLKKDVLMLYESEKLRLSKIQNSRKVTLIGAEGGGVSTTVSVTFPASRTWSEANSLRKACISMSGIWKI